MNGLDLFSGIGGLTKALEGYVQPVAYCENDRYAMGVLLSRMACGDLPAAPIWDDIRTLNAEDLPPVDVIYGGFPCQDISVAGRGAGLEGKRSGLFFEIARLVGEIRPRFIFLENVPAIHLRGGSVVVGTLADLGYDCRWDVLSASDVGANHRRERWWLLARRRTSMDDAKSRELRYDGQNNRAPTGSVNPSSSTGSLLAHTNRTTVSGPTIWTSGGQKPDTFRATGDLADPESAECERTSVTRTRRNGFTDGGIIFSDTDGAGLEGQRQKPIGDETKFRNAGDDGWWSIEPNVGRVASRLPAWLDDLGGKYAHASCITKARAKGIPQIAELREMWQRHQSAKTPPKPTRCLICAIPLSEVSCDGASGSWDVGKWEQETGKLRSVRYGIYAEAVKASEDLRSDLPIRTWTPICEQTLASRVDRLRCLGNSVVPAQAREAFERLIGLK